MYQIRDDKGQALVIENGKYAFKTVSSLTDLKASLWCVKVTEEGSGKEPIYDFFNKATGETLAVSDLDASAIKAGTFATTDSLTVGESFGGWAFSSTYETTLLDNQPMYTYYEPDYVLLLTKGTNNGLQAKRVLAKDIRQDAKSKGAVELTLFNAGTYVLSASEINEYVKDNKFVLTFEKDANARLEFSTSLLGSLDSSVQPNFKNWIPTPLAAVSTFKYWFASSLEVTNTKLRAVLLSFLSATPFATN